MAQTSVPWTRADFELLVEYLSQCDVSARGLPEHRTTELSKWDHIERRCRSQSRRMFKRTAHQLKTLKQNANFANLDHWPEKPISPAQTLTPIRSAYGNVEELASQAQYIETALWTGMLGYMQSHRVSNVNIGGPTRSRSQDR